MIASGLIWTLGRHLNRDLDYDETHRFFWIPMEYCGPLLLIVAAILHFS